MLSQNKQKYIFLSCFFLLNNFDLYFFYNVYDVTPLALCPIHSFYRNENLTDINIYTYIFVIHFGIVFYYVKKYICL